MTTTEERIRFNDQVVPFRDTDPIIVMQADMEGEDKIDDGEGDKKKETVPTTVSGKAAGKPTAFTIDLGDDEGVADKKLSLKSGVKHFAPFKKKPAIGSNNRSPAPNTPPMTKKNSSEPSAVLSSANDKAPEEIDKENNNRNTNSSDLKQNLPQNCKSDQESDAGTYTIDNEEVQAEREKIDEVFGVEKEVGGGEWVSNWASQLQEPHSPNNSDRDELQPLHYRNITPGGSSTASSSSRRRLPALPRSTTVPTTGNSTMGMETAEAYLQDTISVMTAMEARISGDDTITRTSKKPISKATSNGTANVSTTSKEERRLAWERRKNYNPLGGPSSSRPNSARRTTSAPFDPRSGDSPRSLSNSFYTEESDSCSEIDNNGICIQERSSSTHHHHQQQPKPKSLNPTRPNRAFALRRKLNTSDEGPSRPSSASTATASTGGFRPIDRMSVGRHSLRANMQGRSIHQTNSKVSPQQHHRNLLGKKLSASEGRSNSSLSSREADFQAWKRRKNYNPMAMAAASKNNAKHTGVAAAGRVTASVVASASSAEQRKKALIRDHKGTSDEEQQQMHRSASFHYPDGFSRIQHNVYTSEDDSPEECASNYYSSLQPSMYAGPGDLFEVNDDELILPIGGGGGERQRQTQYPPGLSPAASSSTKSTRSSLGRMEALDNLVISTIYSLSTKLCLNSASLVRRSQEGCLSEEQRSIMDTMLYVLEDTDLPASPSKKTSRELAGTLRNLKKVEQALQVIERTTFPLEEEEVDDEEEELGDGEEEEEEEDK